MVHFQSYPKSPAPVSKKNVAVFGVSKSIQKYPKSIQNAKYPKKNKNKTKHIQKISKSIQKYPKVSKTIEILMRIQKYPNIFTNMLQIPASWGQLFDTFQLVLDIHKSTNKNSF